MLCHKPVTLAHHVAVVVHEALDRGVRRLVVGSRAEARDVGEHGDGALQVGVHALRSIERRLTGAGAQCVCDVAE